MSEDFITIPLIFYIVVLSARIDLTSLRKEGWIFDMGNTSEPWYAFYKYYSEFVPPLYPQIPIELHRRFQIGRFQRIMVDTTDAICTVIVDQFLVGRH